VNTRANHTVRFALEFTATSVTRVTGPPGAMSVKERIHCLSLNVVRGGRNSLVFIIEILFSHKLRTKVDVSSTLNEQTS
jgi:hypothetical protein